MSFNLILTLIIIKFCCPMIVFPFKTATEDSTMEIKPSSIEYNTTHFVNDYWSQPAYTTIKIGSAPQEVKVILTYNDCGFKIGKSSNCLNSDKYMSHYNRNLSSDFNYTNLYNKSIYEFKNNGHSAEDSIYAYTDLEMKNLKKINNIGFYLGTDTNDLLCGIIGFKNDKFRLVCDETNNIFQSFKLREIINSNDWFIKYTSKDEGLLIFGPEMDKIYPNYDINKFFITNSEVQPGDHSWTVVIDRIYSGDNNETINKKAVKAEINNDFGLLEGNKEYYYNITLTYFKDYIKKRICTLDYIDVKYYHYFALGCDKDKFGIEDMKKFPELKLVLVCFQSEFTFTYQDLFTETEHKYFFNVIFNEFINERFVLGKVFLRKYPMLINFDSQTVGYYNEAFETEPINDNANRTYLTKSFILLLAFIIIVLIIIAAVTFYFIGKNLNKLKKRKANELIDDDYDYSPNKDQNESIDNNFLEKI